MSATRGDEAPAVPDRRETDLASQGMNGYRIESLDAVWEYIRAIDFTELKRNMTTRSDGLGWTQEMADEAEQYYRQWLFLRRKYEDEDLPPSLGIDKFWHEHMLDTRAYIWDCAHIFGYYHHHFPYFGMRGEADERALEQAWERTQQLHFEEFGDYIYQLG